MSKKTPPKPSKEPKAKRKPRPRAKQGFLPDMEPLTFGDVDDAAAIYEDAKKDRLPYTKAEKDAKENLITKMSEHKLQLYKTSSGILVTMTATNNVATKHVADEDSEGDGEDD